MVSANDDRCSLSAIPCRLAANPHTALKIW